MAHSCVYGICGATWNHIADMKAGGIVDFCLVVRSGYYGDSLFVRQCHDLGVSAILNNGNDSLPGMGSNDPNVYYRDIATWGYDAVGGESEQQPEIDAIQNNLVFYNMGGEGLIPLSNLFANVYPGNAHGFGIVSYLETYRFPNYLHADEVVDSLIIAKNHGCKEVGFLIGAWMPVDAEPYRRAAHLLESRGVTCSGFSVWWGHETDMWTTYNKWLPAIQSLQAEWPPDMRPLKARMSGAPTPPVTPAVDTSIVESLGSSLLFE